MQGKLHGEVPIHFDDEDCEFSLDQSTNYRIEDYSMSSKHLKMNLPAPCVSFGLLDCPNHLLDSFEDKEFIKNLVFSNEFEEVMEKYSKTVFGHDFLNQLIKKKRKKKNDKDSDDMRTKLKELSNQYVMCKGWIDGWWDLENGQRRLL